MNEFQVVEARSSKFSRVSPAAGIDTDFSCPSALSTCHSASKSHSNDDAAHTVGWQRSHSDRLGLVHHSDTSPAVVDSNPDPSSFAVHLVPLRDLPRLPSAVYPPPQYTAAD